MNRDEMTSVILIKTNYSFEYLQSLSNMDIERIYKEKCEQ